MAGYEQTLIIGNVGHSPKSKDVGDSRVCNFTVAVNAYQDYTNWYSVAAWGKLADVCQQYITKGMQVMIVGTVEARAYTGKDGSAKAELQLRAREVKFLSGNNHSSDDVVKHPADDVPF